MIVGLMDFVISLLNFTLKNGKICIIRIIIGKISKKGWENANRWNKKMPVERKIELIESIWDSLRHSEDDIASPSWHKNILNERTAILKSGKAKYISLNNLRAADKWKH